MNRPRDVIQKRANTIAADPVNALRVARRIADVLGQLDSGSRDVNGANLKKFSDALEARLAEWQKRLAPFKGQRVVSYYNSWPCFARVLARFLPAGQARQAVARQAGTIHDTAARP